MADCVKVAVRIRPLVKSETERGCQSCVESVNGEPQLIVREGAAFTFNYVYNTESTQLIVYEGAVKPLISKLFEGYNVTILAYGQTGSGKTYTMGSNCTRNILESEHGIIFRSVRDIFAHINDNPAWSYKITASFMELYKEQLFDLLAPSRAVVDIREDTKGIFIPDLTEKLVESPDSAMQFLIDGSIGRVTGATAMNSQSSRSHAIFTLTIQQQKGGDPSTATTAKFHLVDLAGSERCKKTQAEGERFKEGININAGLLALGNVISALGEGGRTIPSYRSSKLTRLLQDSLGGNSFTLMIACISPADFNVSETLSTLRYADRVRRIKNRPIVNQDPRCAEIAALKRKVEDLQIQLLERGSGGSSDEKVKELETKVRKLTRSYNDNLHEIAELREAMLQFETGHEKLKVHIMEIVTDVSKKFELFDKENLPENARRIAEELKKDFRENIFALQNKQQTLEWNSNKCEPAADVSNDERMELSADQEAMEEQHINKQSQLNQQLRELQQQLALKTEHCEQYSKTSGLVTLSVKENIELKLQYEKQIATLERQKAELVVSIEQLEAEKKEVQAKAMKMEWSKKNAEIDVLHRKLSELSKVVQQKEVAEKKVVKLSNEIQLMKQEKVRLIKEMKQESERWKTWKVTRELEAKRLLEQDRKRQAEMVKMQSIHQKQLTVSKRKLEEVFAVNKRLKEALLVQKAIKSSKETKNPSEQERIQEFIEREVEVLISTVDAQRALQALMEHRTSLTQQITCLRRLTIDGVTSKQLIALEEELEIRNAQIADLQQKILESEEREKHKSGWEVLGTMTEAKKAVIHAVKLAADIRRDALQKEAIYEKNMEELTFKHEETQRRLREREAELINCRRKHDEEIVALEKEHQDALQALQCYAEEKVNLTLHSKEKVFDETLQVSQKECQELQNRLDYILALGKTPKSLRDTATSREFEDLNLSKDGSLVSNSIEASDWRRTPIHKRIKAVCTVIPPAPDMPGVKRSIDGLVRCRCRSGCDTKRCICAKMNQTCGDSCQCNMAKCKHKNSGSSDSAVNETFTVDSDTSKRPKTTREMAQELNNSLSF